MRISTIIPSFNRADLICETVAGALAQTRPPHEVIVVDDGSTDGSPEVLRETFGAAITVVCQPNQGAGAARNAGLRLATGDIIHFQDSDDISSRNTYEVQARAIEQGCDIAYGPWVKAYFDGQQLTLDNVVIQARAIGRTANLHLAVARGAWLTVFQPCLFRRSLLEAAGPYREDLAPTEDWELLYRLTRLRPRMTHTPETLLLYRLHPENQISLKDPSKRVIDRAHLWALLQGHVKSDTVRHPVSRFLFDLKRREVALEVQAMDLALAQPLLAGLGPLHHWLQPLDHLLNRVRIKLRTRFLGSGYAPLFGAAPLNAQQAALLQELGYTVEGHDHD